MTREEAVIYFKSNIENLKRILDKRPNLKDSDLDKEIQASNIAIKALEQQPCEDAISRADAIKQVGNFYTNCERLKMFQHTANEVKQTVADILSDLPPAQSQPKTGHWIRVTDKAGHLVWECDKCDWQQRFNTNYCPNCGARMIEPQESEE